MIEAKELCLKFGKHLILNQVSFKAATGKLSVIIGSNGAGKSSLLKVLTGQWNPQKGTVTYNGTNINQFNKAKLAQMRAVLSQRITIQFPMSVLEVVLLGRYPHVIHDVGKRDREIAMAMLERVGMHDFAKRNILTLSGGQQQRVHMARVWAQIFEVDTACALFLDEPTASLDIRYQHSLLRLAKETVREYAITVIAVLHNMNLAAQYADHIAVMKKGRLIRTGKPQQVLESKLIQEVFGVKSIIQTHPVLDCLQVVTYT